MFTRIRTISLSLVSLLALFFVVAPALALSTPSISTDKADYPPGATVTLTGSGWAAGEAVHIFVNDDTTHTWSLNSNPDPVAGASGSFTYQFQLPAWYIPHYTVTASGPISGTATTTFTDLSIGTYDQCANNLGIGYPPLPPGNCNWINGNLQHSNSTYAEGDATVQRLWLTSLVPGSSHTVTFDYATTKGGAHAYDFLTTWSWSENWIQDADRCVTITGCTSVGDTQFPIPSDPNVPGSILPPAGPGRQFTMRGGTITAAAFNTPIPFVGTYSGDSTTRITITFTVANSGGMCSGGTCDVALWFGAHVARTDLWKLFNGTTGAGTISGSPYHVALALVDGASAGSRDNQMASSAVPANGTIVIVKNAVPKSTQAFSFNLSGNGGLVNDNFSLVDSGTPPNSLTFSEPPGTYSASELNIPAGWTLTGLTCAVTGTGGSTTTLASPLATINLHSSDTVTCTYTDTNIHDLTVSKTATPSFTRTYLWKIAKAVDKTTVNIAAGGTATFNYTVTATPNGFADSAWSVTGKITVANSNGTAFSGVNVTDAINNGGSCTVTNGTNLTVPANGSAVLDYSCSYAAAPSPAAGTNTATATWDKTVYHTVNGSASGTASADFSTAAPTTEINKTITVVDDKTNPASPVTLGTATWGATATTFTYSLVKSGAAGTCTSYTNIASLKETGQSASQTVKVCVGANLTVSKTASGTFNRAYLWSISKAVDKTTVTIAAGGSAIFNYTVNVAQTGVTDSGFTLSGAITVTNPNDFEDVTLTSLTDAVDNGGTCTLASAGPYTVLAGKSLSVNYSCTYASAPTNYSGTNTASAAWDSVKYATPAGTASGTASFTLAQLGSTNKTIHVTDTLVGTLGTVTATDPPAAAATASFTYSHSFPGVGGTCTKYDNTATITETGQTSSQSVTVCTGLDLSVSKTAAGTFNRAYLWSINKLVDQTTQTIAAGGLAIFNYTVHVAQTGVTDSGFTLAGTITVSNPNDFEAVTLTSLADVVDNGGACTVAAGPYTIAAKGSLPVSYSCTYASNPLNYSGSNLATATWDSAKYFTPSGTASGSAAFTLTQLGSTNKTITVTDTLGGALGTLTATDPPAAAASTNFTYSHSFPGVGGTCTGYPNTATINETGQSASQSVTVCAGLDLTVSKTAAGTFNRAYLWSISKAVDKTTVNIAAGGTATFNYTVNVAQTGVTDSGFTLSGAITIHNPNDFEAVTLTSLVDSVSNGGTCSPAAGPYTVTPKGNLTVPYSCAYASNPASYSGTNLATAAWDAVKYFTPTGTASGTASFTQTQLGSTNQTIHVTDTFGGALGSVTATDPPAAPATASFTYSHGFPGVGGTCTKYDNTASITETGQSSSQSVTVCAGLDLSVSKTATPAFGRKFTWSISKSVDQTRINIAAGGTATFTYTVAVNHDSGTDSGWTVNGTITVSNPNNFEAVTVNVTDAVNNGGICTVAGGSNVSIPASSSLSLLYTCSYASAPSTSAGTNTATAAWDNLKFSTPSSSASGSAAFAFTNPVITDGAVTVTDTLGGTLGTVAYTDPSPTTFTYSHIFSGDPPGTCTSHNNTATFTTNTTGTTGSASQTVSVCVGADLTVTKTAYPTMTRTFLWNIAKSVDKTTVRQMSGNATFNYTVIASETGFTDSAFKVTGSVFVTNPNNWEAVTLAGIADLTSAGGTCAVSGAAGASIPAGSTVAFPYTCTFSSAPSSYSGANTATAAWDAVAFTTPHGSASGSAGFVFADGSSGNPTNVNQTITVTDTFNGVTQTLGTVTAVTTQPFTSKTFNYSYSVPVPVAGCVSYTNTAKIVETGQSASVTVQVCKPALVTDTLLCTLTNSQFTLVYTPDPLNPGGYKLNASNPGQFYYNIFYTGPGGVDITVTLPYPFVTQGATPIHIYPNLTTYTNSSGQTCLTPTLPELANQTNQVTMNTYDPGFPPPSYDFTKTATLTIHVPVLTGGFAYINIHLDYGLKGTNNYAKNSTNDAVNKSNTTQVLIKDLQSYGFSDTAGGSTSVTSTNSFKKDPGIGGLVLRPSGDAVQNASINIYLGTSTTPTATITTDKDGWYMWAYKWTGKAQSFVVSMLPPQPLTQTLQTQTVTLKSNGFLVASFTVP